MRRAPIVIGSTLAGLAAILSFRPQTSSLGALPAAAGMTSPTTSGSAPTTAPAATPTTTPPTTGNSGTTAGSTTPPTTTAPTTTSGTRTVTGDAVQTPYGVVQVRVTASGSHITSVQTVQLTAYDGHSASINNYAAPQLQQQVLQVQSAQIYGVSGATYTSSGYAQSVQSALDKLGIK